MGFSLTVLGGAETWERKDGGGSGREGRLGQDSRASGGAWWGLSPGAQVLSGASICAAAGLTIATFSFAFSVL